MSNLLLRGAFAAAAVLLTSQVSLAQDAAEDPVVARVNGHEILRSEVEEAAGQLPPQYQTNLDALFPMLLQRTIDLKLVQVAADAASMEEDPEVKRRMAEIKTDVIRSVYLEKQVADRISDEMVEERYQEFLAANPPQSEVHARHILVKEETEARVLITELEGGADFAELAKEHSIGPSGAQGGDLSYFSKDQMVPAFAEAAFALEKDSYSKDPVQTEFGWHVIQVLDKRETAPPAKEEIEEELLEQLTQEAVRQVLLDLREGAEIEIVSETSASESETEEGDSQ